MVAEGVQLQHRLCSLPHHTAVAEHLVMRMCQHNYSFIEKNTYSSVFLRLDNALRDRRNKLTCMLDSGQPFTAMNFTVFVCFMLFQTNWASTLYRRSVYMLPPLLHSHMCTRTWPWHLTAWPSKSLQQCSLTWWIFVPSLIEIPTVTQEKSRHAKQMFTDGRPSAGRTARKHNACYCCWRHKNNRLLVR